MQEHLFQSLQLIESRFPDCALIVAGEFNRLDTKPIERHFRLKQIVKIQTRKDAILDRVRLDRLFKRDKRESRKVELGRYLCAIDWTMLFSSANC